MLCASLEKAHDAIEFPYGWFAACRMNRFEVVRPMEPIAPIMDVQQIEVTVVDRGWRHWRRTAGAWNMANSALTLERS
jgi:hypothetical protein